VLAEEWQTVPAVLGLDQELRSRGIRDSVQLAWNANNVFGFNRIDWRSLNQACAVITISRFMKHVLARYGVDARVVPNGIPDHWFKAPSKPAVRTLKRGLGERFLITKIARWDPDKRWVATIESVARLKQLGMRPLLLARGGMEAHGAEVIRRAQALGLEVQSVRLDGHEPVEMARRLVDSSNTDLLLIDSYLAPEQCKVLYQASHAVLANSRMEPFGLVGLEAMASGGIAIVGSSGEDYVTPGHDAVSIQSAEAGELVTSLLRIYWNDEMASRIRRAAKATAARYTWTAVINRVLLPYFGESSLLSSLEEERGSIGRSSGMAVRIAPPVFWTPEPVGITFTVPPAVRHLTDSERLVHIE
jgi:glycosyltransferase involved in cell wall biosynthesis